MQEESPEGGRFKKEIFIDNQSYLLLIRDEGGLPEMQVNIYLQFDACEKFDLKDKWIIKWKRKEYLTIA